MKRTYRLDHDLKYYDAVHEHRRVWVVLDGEYIGYGTIIDFNRDAVTIVDTADGTVERFIRANCQFFAEK